MGWVLTLAIHSLHLQMAVHIAISALGPKWSPFLTPGTNKQTSLRWLCGCFSPLLGSRSSISPAVNSLTTMWIESMACTPHSHRLLANTWSIPLSKHLSFPGLMLCICSLTSDVAMSQNTHCKLRILCQKRIFCASNQSCHSLTSPNVLRTCIPTAGENHLIQLRN